MISGKVEIIYRLLTNKLHFKIGNSKENTCIWVQHLKLTDSLVEWQTEEWMEINNIQVHNIIIIL